MHPRGACVHVHPRGGVCVHVHPRGVCVHVHPRRGMCTCACLLFDGLV